MERWMDRLINIHPSLLPSYWSRSTPTSGCSPTASAAARLYRPFRAPGHGRRRPVIVQAMVPVLADDGPVRLASRRLEAEHRGYPDAVRLIAEDRVHAHGIGLGRRRRRRRGRPGAAAARLPARLRRRLLARVAGGWAA